MFTVRWGQRTTGQLGHIRTGHMRGRTMATPNTIQRITGGMALIGAWTIHREEGMVGGLQLLRPVPGILAEERRGETAVQLLLQGEERQREQPGGLRMLQQPPMLQERRKPGQQAAENSR